MKLLAIDTAGRMLSIAAANEDDVFFTQTDTQMKHSEQVMYLIDSQIKAAGFCPKELNGILCMGGPGSFTGLRIGYSIAKGLALSLSIPFAAVPTLECAAWQCSGLTLAVIEARKNAYFYAFFQDGQRLTEDKDAGIAQIAAEIEHYDKKILLTGYGSENLYENLSRKQKDNVSFNHENKCYAKELISIAKSKNILNSDCTAFLNSGPEYLRLSHAELSL